METFQALLGRELSRALAAAGIDETLRAERLSVADFARLADALHAERGARA